MDGTLASDERKCAIVYQQYERFQVMAKVRKTYLQNFATTDENRSDIIVSEMEFFLQVERPPLTRDFSTKFWNAKNIVDLIKQLLYLKVVFVTGEVIDTLL